MAKFSFIALLCLLLVIRHPHPTHASIHPKYLPPLHTHCLIGVGQRLTCFASPLERRAAVPTGGGILALLYNAPYHLGASLAIVGQKCGVAATLPILWNNRVSSVRSGSCGLYLYDGDNGSGVQTFLPAPGASLVEATLNNRASSFLIP